MIKIIAEIGINHCGFLNRALRLVDVAHDAGANVAKFQLYHTDTLLRDVPYRSLLKSCELPFEDYRLIADYCKGLGIEWMASCFDLKAVDEAVALGATTIKVGSGEIVNLDLIRHIAKHKRDLILSTGAATDSEISEALNAYDEAHETFGEATLLHCTSLYPARHDECNLAAIRTLKSFYCPVGFSDHTVGFEAAVAAVGAGAEIIERHIMLEPGCPDEAVSLTPENFRGYVATIRRTEQMMGDGEKKPCVREMLARQEIRYRWHSAS